MYQFRQEIIDLLRFSKIIIFPAYETVSCFNICVLTINNNFHRVLRHMFQCSYPAPVPAPPASTDHIMKFIQFALLKYLTSNCNNLQLV